MTLTLDEAIQHCDDVAEELEEEAVKGCCDDTENMNKCTECAAEHRQLADWLRELKERREIQDILLQFLVDSEFDICCADFANDEKECEICAYNCNNNEKDCWIRWAKMKAREVNNVND